MQMKSNSFPWQLVVMILKYFHNIDKSIGNRMACIQFIPCNISDEQNCLKFFAYVYNKQYFVYHLSNQSF